MPGVKKVVQVGDTAVAVVADTWWQAKTALDALPIVWDEGPNAKVSSATIAEMLKEGLDAPSRPSSATRPATPRRALAERGEEGRGGLRLPVPEPRHHGADERHGAAGRPSKCEVWAPTQNGEAALAAAAEASGLPVAKCDVYKIHLGGGFGRRGAVHDYVRQAVAIAKQMPGTPVKLIWSREEDMMHGRYHPVTQCKLVGGLDAQGQPHRRCTCASPASRSSPACARRACRTASDPVVFQGLNPSGPEGVVRLHGPEPADRPRDAQPARAAGLLARREHQPERASTSNASWTSSPMRPARIRSSSGAS